MKSGTCGDYSNLVISVLTRLGYKTKYAFVNVDCYGNPQEHICASVWNEHRWQLIDATLPYRKWHSLDCPHKEYELLSYDEMKIRLKQDEQYWANKAIEWNKEAFAGLLYAPWLHEDITVCTNDSLEMVFFLLIIDSIGFSDKNRKKSSPILRIKGRRFTVLFIAIAVVNARVRILAKMA